jgi:hypothetical protein
MTTLFITQDDWSGGRSSKPDKPISGAPPTRADKPVHQANRSRRLDAASVHHPSAPHPRIRPPTTPNVLACTNMLYACAPAADHMPLFLLLIEVPPRLQPSFTLTAACISRCSIVLLHACMVVASWLTPGPYFWSIKSGDYIYVRIELLRTRGRPAGWRNSESRNNGKWPSTVATKNGWTL